MMRTWVTTGTGVEPNAGPPASLFLLLVLVLGVGCATPSEPPKEEISCPYLGGDLPPSDCARVEGVALDRTGAPLVGAYLDVDSLHLPSGQRYFGHPTAVTDSDGRFGLWVYRTFRLAPPGSPDTASLPVGAYSAPDPNDADEPMAQAWLPILFFRGGDSVRVTTAALVFDLE